MGKTSRTKGAQAEREVARILRESGAFPDAQRDLDQTRGHDNGRDLIGTDTWVMQVKRRAKMTRGVVLRGLAEARSTVVAASAAGDDSVVYTACIHRGDCEQWMVTTACIVIGSTLASCGVDATMTLDDFCNMVRSCDEL